MCNESNDCDEMGIYRCAEKFQCNENLSKWWKYMNMIECNDENSKHWLAIVWKRYIRYMVID